MLKLWVLQLRRSAFVETDLGRRKIMVIYFSLLKLCKTYLPSSHVPNKIIFLDEMPLTRGGKIDYLFLENGYYQGDYNH